MFDEAHHLTAYKSGGKVKKTENYRLAEVLKDHCRDLLLLSATPHQGDHFRFWMLVQLLDPTLFRSPDDMVDNRHRLNAVIFRRTKADACRPDGSTLFARRWVHTESFVMSEPEREFYNALQVYLMDGFALAKQRGNKGRALGFVMTIFQKIAASSFAAVHRTLRRRMIALTIQEGLVHDAQLGSGRPRRRLRGGQGVDSPGVQPGRRPHGDHRGGTHPGRPETASAQEDDRGGTGAGCERVHLRDGRRPTPRTPPSPPWNSPCPKNASESGNCWSGSPARSKPRSRS